ncbi:amidohydrolase family protein [Actinacidiphila guanduensis]|uniref:Cytosine/adenosine deaminase n=1 Tax=Actinacidiphila guanduensis TaxID=310781 RepID=A0A1H0SDL6_9ACTN|nr:amidohydrolase family protein [Actinacidiphila guanduensis]SDP39810.1 Cytosine/adenosine deaminase [Actinacidiphila guanduensis]
MNHLNEPDAPPAPGRPVVFRGASVVTVDPSLGTLDTADVLVRDGRVAGIGPHLDAPADAFDIDAHGGILMPGMIDTHRHMWQTVLRGYGADWTLTNYLRFFYAGYAHMFRPQDIYAGNLLAALEGLDAGVTTSVDWSHNLQTLDHAEAAVDALEGTGGRFFLAYGNIHENPAEWSAAPGFRDFVRRRIDGRSDRLGLQLAIDLSGDASFPEKAAFDVARDLGAAVTMHTGVRDVAGDENITMLADHGYLFQGSVYVHAATLSAESYRRIADTGGYVSVASESECNAGQGYPPTWQLREHGVPVCLSTDSSAWWSGDMFNAMRATLNATRAREHLESHDHGESLIDCHLRAADVVAYATRGGAAALGLDDRLGSITVGREADLVLLHSRTSPAMFPVLNPAGHIVFQAGRGDVHTVMVGGRFVKYGGVFLLTDRLNAAKAAVSETLDHLRGCMGAPAWKAYMSPDAPRVPLPPFRARTGF